MASAGSKINAQIAVIPDTKCQLCDEKKIKWKCFTCEEYLCDLCNKAHLRSKASSHHKVVSVHASTVEELQDELDKQNYECTSKTCRSHPKEVIILYCHDCNKFICKACITQGLHKTHMIRKMDEIIEEKSKELSDIIQIFLDKMSSFQKMVETVTKIHHDYFSDSAKCIEAIKSQNSRVKSALDQLANEAIEKITFHEIKIGQRLKDKELKARNTIQQLQEIIKDCQTKQERKQIELVQFVDDVKLKPIQFENIPVPKTVEPPNFVTNDMDAVKLMHLFGELQLPEMKDTNKNTANAIVIKAEVSSSTDLKSSENKKSYSDTDDTRAISDNKVTSCTMENVDRVAVICENIAWIGKCGSRKYDIKLATSDGHVIKTLNTDFVLYDMAVSKSGELFLSEWRGRGTVRKLTIDGRFIDLYRAQDGCHTTGITVADNGDIIAGLNDKETDTGKIVRLNSKGELVSTIQFEKFSPFRKLINRGVPLFKYIYNISSNRNGDIIVAQGGNVVVVDNEGHKKFTYGGDVKVLEEEFCSYYTVTDQYGHIIISDSNNALIHILDINGNFTGFIMTPEHGLQKPRGLSIDNKDNLWVCSYGNDKIIVKSKYLLG